VSGASRSVLATLAVASVVGCASLLGPPADTACEDYIDEFCDTIGDCSFINERDCRDELEDQVGNCRDVVSYEGNLDDCLDDLSDTGCSDVQDEDYPSSCEITWVTDSGDRVEIEPPEGPSQSSECEVFINCQAELDAINNTTVTEGLMDTYGPNGSCWTTTPEAAQACSDACDTALESNGTAYPEVAECNP
jgi:hypothetical protein